MEESKINKEERQLWSCFKKTSRQRKTVCLNDNSLSAYLDGRLKGSKGKFMEEHLASCPACLEKLIQMRVLLAIEIEEAPLTMRQKAKDHVSGDLGQTNQDAFAWWKLILQPQKSLAWGVVLLLICAAGIKSGEIMTLSRAEVFSGQSNNLVESALDVLGMQDNGII